MGGWWAKKSDCITVNVYHYAVMNRPKLPKNLRRVVISARILPATKAKLAKLTKRKAMAIGELIDAWVAAEE